MFRGKESSNRIEYLDKRVIEFWCFGLPAALGVGGGWMGDGGGWMGVGVVGGCPTHVHMHVHARTCMHAHARVVNMIISCKWPLPLGESLGIPYDVICTYTCMHVCACACMCTCVGGTLSPATTHIHPTPRGDPWNQSKFNST